MNYFKLLFTVVLMSFGLLQRGAAQNSKVKYNYLNVPASLYTQNKLANKANLTLNNQAFDLTKLLPKNYKKDGTRDYTAVLQKGIDNNATVMFPNFPILINDSGLTLRSNTVLLFQANSKLILKPSNKGRYELLRIHNVSNVKVYAPNIDGNRDNHIGNDGEWGVGISIYSSHNIDIYNPVIKNCWGDGMSISKFPDRPTNSGVAIYSPVIDHNRRNGISIASANGLKIINPVISNTYGTPPMAAIDIEPASSKYLLDSIFIESPITYNSRYGIILALTRASGRNGKPINITINNHHDLYSTIGFRIARFKEIYAKNPALLGEIKINNPKWEKNKIQALKIEETYNLSPNIKFKGDNNYVNKALINSKAKKITSFN